MPLAKGVPASVPPAVGRPSREGLCIDWHNVLQHHNELYIRDAEKTALQKVLSSGRFFVWIISFTGKDRRRKTESLMERCLAPYRAGYPGILQGWLTTLKKVGHGGKVHLALEKGCKILVDDNSEICQEANSVDMVIYPIVTHHHSHDWWSGPKYTNFQAAAEELVTGGRTAQSGDQAASSSAAA